MHTKLLNQLVCLVDLNAAMGIYDIPAARLAGRIYR